MLLDIRSRLEEDDIQALLEWSLVVPEPEILAAMTEQYKSAEQGRQIVGYESEDQIIGFVGYSLDEDKCMTLHDMAVVPEARGGGFGRGMILDLIAQHDPARIVTEADEESVHFFRSIGFTVASIGGSSLFEERYHCTYETVESQE